MENTRKEIDPKTIALLNALFDIVGRLIVKASTLIEPNETYRDGGSLVVTDNTPIQGLLEEPRDEAYIAAHWHYVSDFMSSPVSGQCVLRFFVQVGQRNQHAEDCLQYAIAKSECLQRNLDLKTSYQARDETRSVYGGGIRVGIYTFSFSGLPEALDEAVMLYAAIHCELLTYEAASAMAHPESLRFLDIFRASSI